jgi:hypothetical protein
MYQIAVQLSKVLFTLEQTDQVRFHGHLTSHNVFLEIRNSILISLKISDIENVEFMEYGNMFYDYRVASVWSPPESLKQIKKMSNMNISWDVYSFGMILWEIWH